MLLVVGLTAGAPAGQPAAGSDTQWASQADAKSELGRKLFTQAAPPCALCHTLKDAEAEGAIGPSLDELKPDPERVARALRNGIGQMPSYQASLSEEEMQALAQYVAKAAEASR